MITGQKDLMVEAQFSFCYIIVTKTFLSAGVTGGVCKIFPVIAVLFIYLFIPRLFAETLTMFGGTVVGKRCFRSPCIFQTVHVLISKRGRVEARKLKKKVACYRFI